MSEFEKKCIGIVNQLYDLAEVPVEKRQQINDTAWNYTMEQVKNLTMPIVNSSALTELESKLLLPLIEKRRLEIDDYTIEFHELGHTVGKLKANTD